MFVADALMDFQRIFGSPCQLTVYSGYSRTKSPFCQLERRIIREMGVAVTKIMRLP